MSSDEVVTSSKPEDKSEKVKKSESTECNYKSAEEKLKADELMQLFKEKFHVPTVVVDLDRVEKDGRKIKCLNVECDSEKELFCPPEFARKYYSQPKGKNQAICKECLDKAFEFIKDLEDNFREENSVFSCELPTGNDVIVVDDEEEENEAEALKKRFMEGDKDSQEMYNILNSPVIDQIIKDVCKSFNYAYQREEQIGLLHGKMQKIEDSINSLNNDIKKNQDSLFLEMRNFYDAFQPNRKDLEPLEVPYEEMRPPAVFKKRSDENDCIFTGLITDYGPSHLPPHGIMPKPELKVGNPIFAMRVSVFSEWVPAMIEEIIPRLTEGKVIRHYRVAVNPKETPGGTPSAGIRKEITAQLLAYHTAAPVRYQFGTRVISEFTSKARDYSHKKFYSGIIAEVPSTLNNYRYLIFFDDGRVQYVNHSVIRLVCESKPLIWEHFAPKMQSFIKRYILTFPERAMLKVKNLDSVKLEYKGYWVNARVVEIDSSLVHLFHLQDKNYEWLYRGSMRLYPMWMGVNAKKMAVSKPRGFAARRTTTGPYVQYENIDVDDETNEKDNSDKLPILGRAVAKKSSTQIPDIEELQLMNRADRRMGKPAYEQRDGILVQHVPSKLVQPKTFQQHICDSSCVSNVNIGMDTKDTNPLAVPVLYGFSRETDVAKNSVVYVAPCGLKMDAIKEVLQYLTTTNLKMSIDKFDYDPWVNIFNEYVVATEHMVLKDLSFGVENIPIPCVNTLNTEVPKYMDYMTNRRPTEGVELNLDPEFLVGCDCTDNCQDKEKCACWQLTLSEGNCTNLSKNKDFHRDTVGYQYQRLPNLVATGIYECNSRCKCCTETCLNRVVQHPLKHKLQLFKTKNKGWGTRCLNDIPAGTFICVYVGNIFTEAVANEDGRLYGDEYFAELDYIEVVEANKEGYEEYMEPDTYDPRLGNGHPLPSALQSDEEFDQYFDGRSNPSGMNLRKRKHYDPKQTTDSEEEDDPEEIDTDTELDNQNKKMDIDEEMSDIPRKPSVRLLFGENESVYIMDAKHSGNIGRYLNDLEDNFREENSVFSCELPTGNDVIVVDDEEEESEAEALKKMFMEGDKDSQEMYNILNSPVIDQIIKDVCKSFNYAYQREEQIGLLHGKMQKIEDSLNSLNNDIKKNQDSLFLEMRNFYDAFQPNRKDLEPLEVPYEEMRPPAVFKKRSDENDCIFTGLITDYGPSHLPPHGIMPKPELKVGNPIFAMRVAVFSEWVPAMIEEIIPRLTEGKVIRHYRVAVNPKETPGGTPSAGIRKEITAQLLAYHTAAPVRYQFGTRVISEFTSKARDYSHKKFYSGIIAEVPSALNNYRYLIFFDDGRVQYVNHSVIRLVCESKPLIWEHFAPKMQSFIKRYILTFPERAMLKVKNLDSVKLEYKGYWVNARVVEIDSSLVHLFHLQDKNYEWLYRGSMRLYPMWMGVNAKKMAVSKPRGFAARRTTTGPYVQYENIDVDDETNEKDNSDKLPILGRAVAKKSSTQIPDIEELQLMNLSDRRMGKPAYEQRDGILVQHVPSKLVQPKTFQQHICDSSCVSNVNIGMDTKDTNPLAVPVLYGFSRETDVAKNSVVYVAPCGLKMNAIKEVLQYLTTTNLKMSIDKFDYDPWVNIFNEYVVATEHMVLKDLSFGVENIPIPCVNTLNTEVPKYMDYMTNRRPTEGVELNLDPEFLVGCDCTDNCQDKEKCACWQLTLSEGNCTNLSKNKDFHRDTVGYQYQRLPNLVATGIYECNSRCKCCSETCLNRVVQHPLKHKLQLFKTKNKGWGTRCLNDIPAGTFICVYVGNIFTEAVANEDGRLYGDEYFAELDYIEVVEANKEGYEEYMEPDTYDPRLGNGHPLPSALQSDEEFDQYFDGRSNPSGMNLRKRKHYDPKETTDSEEEDDPEEIDTDTELDNQNKKMDIDEEMSDIPRKPSVRLLFGENESVYIMDAKHSGNIGRYLNHSCDPNIFVQNVFVDSHDLRFPWVAFFSLKYIRAGTELTWDYRYEVDSVPGKKLKCYCMSENCRGRLL